MLCLSLDAPDVIYNTVICGSYANCASLSSLLQVVADLMPHLLLQEEAIKARAQGQGFVPNKKRKFAENPSERPNPTDRHQYADKARPGGRAAFGWGANVPDEDAGSRPMTKVKVQSQPPLHFQDATHAGNALHKEAGSQSTIHFSFHNLYRGIISLYVSSPMSTLSALHSIKSGLAQAS